ncbi:MAG TPA: multicopper oxidase family protein, partial [Verrucomicrobiae bacterium]
MKLRKAVGACAISFACAFVPVSKADLFELTDINPDPHIFECDVTAIQNDVTIAGATVHAFNFKDENAGALPPASAGIPIQVIRVKVGDMIICRFKNQLSSDSASIHWHGIELDNDSDGTAVTQDAVLPGQSYTYQFQTFRPGIFWFHSHMLPGNTLFGGMYGVIVIENDDEPALRMSGVLPAEADTHIVAMSDIEFDGTGKVGKQLSGVTKSENELIELCHLYGIGDPGGSNPACELSQRPGSKVLVNGQNPDPAAHTPKFVVPSGKRVRLQLFNESISRHFRLKLINSGDNTLYRIGGQGGLLNNVVVEGGIKGTWDTKFDAGEIVLGSGMRADVLVVPSGPPGTIVQLVGNSLTPPFKISQSFPANYPIAYFEISGTSTDTPPADGDPILASVGNSIENIKTGPATPLVDSPPYPGSNDETIHLTTQTPTGPGTFTQNQPGIDRYASVLDSNAGNGDWLLVPRPPVARYAHVGDVLELTIQNDTDSAHPYHLHGFSMQPVRMVDTASGTTLYEFPYEEFVDTIDVYAGQSYVFRTRIDDRPKICDLTPNNPPDPGPVLAACTANPCGGVVGRWLFHCHIVGHGALGMIGEVTILPTVDQPPQITCPADIVKNNDPGLCSAVVTFADPV